MFEVVKGAKLVAANSISNSETAFHVNLSPPNNGIMESFHEVWIKRPQKMNDAPSWLWTNSSPPGNSESSEPHYVVESRIECDT